LPRGQLRALTNSEPGGTIDSHRLLALRSRKAAMEVGD
jgi:hypothetical protein